MIQQNKTKARKLFWLALCLFVIAQMFQVFADPSQDFVSDLMASLTSGIGLFPLGVLYPIKRLMDFTGFNQLTGNSFYNLFSLVFAFLAALTLLFGARVYAQGKGLHEAVGYLGLFGFVGIAILLIMPDKSRARRFQ